MENASKALLMAAEVLLGVLLLTLMASIIYFFTNYQAEIESNQNAKEIYRFNSQFEVYKEKEYLTAQDVLSIYNLAQNYNSKFENEEPIKVYISDTLLNSTNVNNKINLKDILDKTDYGSTPTKPPKTYKIDKIEPNQTTKKINNIKIVEIN